MTARELSSRLAALLRNERSAMADFLLALADFDAKRLWRDLGHASLFAYLRRELHLSACAAQYRKTAAELIREYPRVERALREGDLCLSTVIEVAKVLSPENEQDVLPRFFGLSRREAESLAVSMRPLDVVPRREVVTVLRPAAAAAPQPLPESGCILSSESPSNQALVGNSVRPAEIHSESGLGAGASAGCVASSLPEETAAPTAVAAPGVPLAPRRPIQPLTADLSRLHLTVSNAFVAKLAAARDALSHAKPGATTEEILEAALDLVLAARAKRNGLVAKPRETPRASRPDRIPAHVRRAVWERDGGRCQFRLESGEICGSTWMLEVDHIEPCARGGPPTVENCRVTCFGHNQLAARRVFGDAHMDRYARRRWKPGWTREREVEYGARDRCG